MVVSHTGSESEDLDLSPLSPGRFQVIQLCDLQHFNLLPPPGLGNSVFNIIKKLHDLDGMTIGSLGTILPVSSCLPNRNHAPRSSFVLSPWLCLCLLPVSKWSLMISPRAMLVPGAASVETHRSKRNKCRSFFLASKPDIQNARRASWSMQRLMMYELISL